MEPGIVHFDKACLEESLLQSANELSSACQGELELAILVRTFKTSLWARFFRRIRDHRTRNTTLARTAGD